MSAVVREVSQGHFAACETCYCWFGPLHIAKALAWKDAADHNRDMHPPNIGPPVSSLDPERNTEGDFTQIDIQCSPEPPGDPERSPK